MASDDSDGLFESFTDLMLIVTGLMIILVILLSLRVNEEFNALTRENVFVGGAIRPMLYTDSYIYLDDQYSEGVVGQISFYSPSLALALTRVEGGQVQAATKGETFSGQLVTDFYDALLFLTFIDPGALATDPETYFLGLGFGEKTLVDNDNTKVISEPNNDLLHKVLEIAWQEKGKFDLTQKDHNDYLGSSVKVYFESFVAGEQKGISIGHKSFLLPDDLENGNLDFLISLSSSSTQFTYLGDIQFNFDKSSNSRIDLLRNLGFDTAAEHYMAFSFGSEKYYSQDIQADDVREYEDWLASGTEEERQSYFSSFNGDYDLARHDYYRQIALQSSSRVILDAVKSGQTYDEIPRRYLPPLVAFPDAREAYIATRLREGAKPPEWVIEEFLEPLGFDMRVLK